MLETIEYPGWANWLCAFISLSLTADSPWKSKTRMQSAILFPNKLLPYSELINCHLIKAIIVYLFCRNLLTRNVAMGATAPSKAPSQDHNSKSVVPKDSSATQNAVLPDSSQTQSNTRETSASGIRESGAKAAKGEEWERMRRAREAYEAKQTIKPLSTDREANGNLLQGLFLTHNNFLIIRIWR